VAEAKSEGFNILEAMSSNIGEKAMREIYAWPFMDAVKENVGSVMCSYNQVCNPVTRLCIHFNIKIYTTHVLKHWTLADLFCTVKVNNSYGCQNSYLLNGVLKDEFGFQGFVVSDCS
jgi:beta-glucosidase-like glycosyl hydrolase